jgi:type IV pilus assembly protein PilN
VLPTGVQVLSIDPEVAKDGSVVIHMRVSGARDRAIELVRNLEKSRHFVTPRITGEALAQTQGQGNNNPNAPMQPVSASTAVNFDILAAYRPLNSTEDKASTAEGTAKKDRAKDETTAPGRKSSAPTRKAKKRGVQ